MRLVERTLAVIAVVLSLLSAAHARAQDTAVLHTDPDASGVRGLPLCSTYMHLPAAGEAYNCRPQWHGTRHGPTFELGEIELGGGGVESLVALQHSLFTIGFSGTMWLTR